MMENHLNEIHPVPERVRIIQEQIANACSKANRPSDSVRLMAVTKTVAPELVNEAIGAGVALLGENRAQELLAKYDAYQKDGIEIHFIGHLQTNKVRQVVDKVSMIQSLDSIALAQEIQRQCEKIGKTMDCLVEINIGEETSKSGIYRKNAAAFLEQLTKFDKIHVRGLMAIPPICEDMQEKERNFAFLHELFIDIQQQNIDNIDMEILSMGMSDDYLLAIKHGSTLVRLGTILFGKRGYCPAPLNETE